MPEAPDTSAPRVLAAVDDPATREGLEQLLARESFQATVASDWAEVLKLAGQGAFDLLLVDLDSKAGMNGPDCCRSIKSAPATAGMPILFLTSHARGDEILRMFEAGANEFVSKPFRPEELVARARMLIRKGREERYLIERARKLAEKVAERDDELDDLRRFAQDIVGCLPSALLVMDGEGAILYVNAPLLAWLKAERREVIGRKVEEFIQVRKLAGVWQRALEAAAQRGEPSQLRRVEGFLQVRPDRISDLTLTPVEYAGVRQVLVVIEDVTDQARMETAVAMEREKLNEVVNALNTALCLVSRDLKLLWKNRTFDQWFWTEEGGPVLAFLKGDDSWVQPVFGSGHHHQMTWQHLSAGGHPRHYVSIIAPVKEETDKPATQALVLMQDVTDHEARVEQLSLLRDLSQFLQRTLDAERLNQVILLCMSAGAALAFNRAFLFKREGARNVLEARAAIGPTSREDAYRIWGELSRQNRTLRDLVDEVERRPAGEHTVLFDQVRGLNYRMDGPEEIVARTALEKKAQLVGDSSRDPRVTEDFRKRFGAPSFVTVPLVSTKGLVVGVILADNVYSGRPITEEHVNMLTLFASQAALAIENADTFAELQASMGQLRAAHEKILHGEQLATVGRMAAHVAHEIRNPLATIGGFARAILKRPDNQERVVRNARIIAEESARLERMLKGVMDFSRPSNPVLKNGDLNSVTEKALRTHAEFLAQHGVQADLDLDPSMPEVPFDESQILQVISNLLRNATESMPKGGALALRTSRQGDVAVLTIRDTGTGIPKNLQERVFSPFFTTKSDGTGLGLAVTKKIVDDHGGRIECASLEGRGSTFTIYLPLHRGAGAHILSSPSRSQGSG